MMPMFSPLCIHYLNNHAYYNQSGYFYREGLLIGMATEYYCFVNPYCSCVITVSKIWTLLAETSEFSYLIYHSFPITGPGARSTAMAAWYTHSTTCTFAVIIVSPFIKF